MTPKEFRTWKGEQDAAIKAQREETISSLRALAPKELATYFEEDCSLIENLLDYGSAGRKYRDREAESYGSTSLRDLRRKLAKLRGAWKGLVRISVRHDDRLEVQFSVVG